MRPRTPRLPLRSHFQWLGDFRTVSRFAPLSLMLTVVGVLGCGDGSSTEPNVRPTISITAPANGTAVLDGAPLAFTAAASDNEDGSLSSAISWMSSIDGAIGSGGNISPTLSTGSHTVTASVSDSDGESASASVTVVVHQPPTVSITSPADDAASLAGSVVTFTGTATDPEDGDLATAIAWSSDLDGDLGTGASVSATPSPGTHTITASVADEHGATAAASITFTVTANAAPAIAITEPADGTTILEGSELTFTGAATDAEDGDLTADISWSSDRTGAIGTGGSVTATLQSGQHVITAAVGDSHGVTVSTEITVTVSPDMPPTVSISSPADNTSVVEGTSITFTGAATDTEDGDLTTEITWTSDIDLALGTGGSIAATLSVGTHTITAAVADSKGQSDTESISVTITADQAPGVTITAPADGTSSTQGTPITFTAEASDPEDGDLTASVTWTSSLDGAFGTGGSVTASLSAGTHVVTAAVTDDAGHVASATITVVITGVAAIACGEQIAGSIGAAAEVDEFLFAGTLDDRILIGITEVSGFGGSPVPQVTVLNPNGSQLGSDLDANGERIYRLPSTGQYRIRVRADNQAATGNYSLRVECLTGITIAHGDLRSSSIGTGEMDFFFFDGDAGDDVLLSIVETAGFTSFRAPEATVFGTAGEVVVGAFTNSQVRATLPTTGLYTVRVRGSTADAAGTYSLGLEGLSPLSPDTVRIGLGALQGGSIDAAAETDLIVFDGSAGTSVFLSVLASPNLLTVQGTLFAPSGQSVGTDLSNARAEVTLPETGRYTLRVRSSSLVQTGAYVVGLEGVPPLLSPDTVRIALGDLRTSTISAIGDMDFFVFSGGTGDNVLLSIMETSGFISFRAPEATVFGPTGDVVVGAFTNSQVRATLPATGLYTVRVRGSTADATGTFALGLEGIVPTTPGATTLTVGGASVQQSIDAVLETDMLVFDGTAGGSVDITLGKISGIFTPQLTVYSPAGDAMLTFTTGTQTLSSLPATGTYVVRVRASNLVTTGVYSVQVQ